MEFRTISTQKVREDKINKTASEWFL